MSYGIDNVDLEKVRRGRIGVVECLLLDVEAARRIHRCVCHGRLLTSNVNNHGRNFLPASGRSTLFSTGRVDVACRTEWLATYVQVQKHTLTLGGRRTLTTVKSLLYTRSQHQHQHSQQSQPQHSGQCAAGGNCMAMYICMSEHR